MRRLAAAFRVYNKLMASTTSLWSYKMTRFFGSLAVAVSSRAFLFEDVTRVYLTQESDVNCNRILRFRNSSSYF